MGNWAGRSHERAAATDPKQGLSVGPSTHHKGRDMKQIVLAVLFGFVATGAYADTCKKDAADKKLAGAALTSFMKKCQNDARAACEVSSKEKKLAGAAKTSHIKKCVTDKVGT
jgi:hypothetical protein